MTNNPTRVRQARYELTNGDIILVTPINQTAFRMLNAAAFEAFPAPDPEPYKRLIPDALIPGTTTDAKDDPDYLKALATVARQRNQRVIGLLLDAGVTIEDSTLVETYRPTIESLRARAVGQPIEAAIVSDKVALLLLMLFESDADVSAVLDIIRGHTLLTEAEVFDGYAYFPRLAMGGDDGGGSTDGTTDNSAEHSDSAAG